MPALILNKALTVHLKGNLIAWLSFWTLDVVPITNEQNIPFQKLRKTFSIHDKKMLNLLRKVCSLQ